MYRGVPPRVSRLMVILGTPLLAGIEGTGHPILDPDHRLNTTQATTHVSYNFFYQNKRKNMTLCCIAGGDILRWVVLYIG